MDLSRHCSDLTKAGIQISQIDGAVWEASYGDPHITHVTAIDPGLTWGLGQADTTGLIDYVHLIGLGREEHRLLATDFDSGFAGLLPNAQIDHIVPAMHFSALPLCKPLAEAILVEEQDDPVCSDPDGTDKQAVYAAIVGFILSDLGL